MKLFNYTDFINENVSGDKLYNAGMALGIPMKMKWGITTGTVNNKGEFNYKVGDIIELYDSDKDEMIPAFKYLTGGYNYGPLEKYSTQSRKKLGFVKYVVSPNKKYLLGNFGSIHRKSMYIRPAVIMDSNSKVIAIISYSEPKESWEKPYSRFFIYDDDKDKNKWKVKNDKWKDFYFDTITGFWDTSKAHVRSKLGIAKYKL